MTNQKPRCTYEERAKRIIEFYLRFDKDKLKTLRHFKDEGVPARSIHRIITNYEKRGDINFKKIPGRSKKINSDEAYDKLASMFKQDPKMSCGDVATRLGVSKTTVLRILRQMRSDNVETYREVDTVICPTCHQRCDPKVLDAIRKRKEEIRAERKTKKPKRKTKVDKNTTQPIS
jgi:DNA-binding transcriptional MerR regulator